MKTSTYLVIFVLGIMFTTGCVSEKRNKNCISVSIMPVKYFVDRLTGETIEVNVMVPAGAGHDTYSPTTKQFQKLSDSKLYIRIGYLGYEQAWINRLIELNPDMQTLNLSDGIELIRGEPIRHGDHFHEGGVDPHIWMSPKVMMELLPKIRDAIIKSFPELEDSVNKNYMDLMIDLETIHINTLVVSKNAAKNKFMIFHPALTYLARDYELEQISIEYEGKEPSPAQLTTIIKMAKEEKIPIIFIQEEYDVRNAEQIAKETGAEIVQINPMAYNWMQSMTEIAQALQSRLEQTEK